MNVERIMTRTPVTCSTTDPVFEIARLMRDKGVGFVVVLRAGRVAGIVTDRQLATRVVAEKADPRDLKAQDVMTRDPATVRADDDFLQAIETMRAAGYVRRLPVVDAKDQLVGVVSLSDIAVVMRDVVEALLAEETRHALNEVRVPSGGKSARKDSRKRRSSTKAATGVAARRVPAYSG